MRGLTSTILLLVVLAGLGGYIYFVESKKDPTDATAKPKAFELTAENIDELQIRNATGAASRVRREGGSWKLVEPVAADADNGIVGTVTTNLASLEVQRVVDENPKDLAQYGLNPARIEVGFRLRDQKEFQRLLVGDKTPTGGDFYAKRPNENRVFLIASFLDAILNKTPLELRDKAILKFERDKAEGLEVVRGASTIQFAKNGLDWRIVKPVSARADYGASEGLLTRLSTTNMLIAVSEGGDLKEYGLDRPSLTASALIGSSRATLLLGRLGKDNTYYARDASRPVIFSVEQALYNDFAKDIADFRRKDLFDARSFNANRLELKRGANTVAFQKTQVDGKDTWRNAAGQNADAAKVEEVLTTLSNMQAQSFQATAHPSLANPVLVATIRFDDTKTETVTFARSGKDVFASRTDEPGAARLDANGFEEAMKAVDGLK
ncbi:MAG: DUF4340 domain-containing protein [Acidobacteria bacterium]|nr:DUF4340 domain-containing protein [Acidobacteriota bacterium]